ncbi:MAG: tetraacyldisaccharide 4'-kinase [Bdellovibrionaceae bacterium]|nr:tetraacyldisaccharide 4'-kinase [Pseudobdellovibrionaceae bacterium]
MSVPTMTDVAAGLLSPLGSVFQLGVAARNSLYDRGWLVAEEVGRPVVGIGNLTTGGTGKTPLTAWLAQQFLQRGHLPAVISRGYKAILESEVGRVDITSGKRLSQLSRLFGDEPTMLAHRLAKVPVYIGSDKVAVGRFAVEDSRPDVILADDAFQHRRLKRNFDLVLLDATEPGWHFRPLPAGRLREPLTALSRAHAVIVTKVNLADPVRVERLRDQARMHMESHPSPLILEMEYRLTQFLLLEAFRGGDARGTAKRGPPRSMTAAEVASEKVLLVSAIGRPQAFRRLVEMETGTRVVGHVEFGDHHAFAPGDIARIAAQVRETGATLVICTEKDAVKIDTGQTWSCPTYVSRLEAVPRGTWDEFHARLDRALF